MGGAEQSWPRIGMPARVGRRDRIARYRMTPIAMSIDRRACPRRAILPRRRLRAGGTRPTDIEIPPKHSASSVRIAEALVRSSPPNALHSAARRPGTNVRLLNMVGRLVGCNASLGGRCSGQAGTALSTDRRARARGPAHRVARYPTTGSGSRWPGARARGARSVQSAGSGPAGRDQPMLTCHQSIQR